MFGQQSPFAALQEMSFIRGDNKVDARWKRDMFFLFRLIFVCLCVCVLSQFFVLDNNGWIVGENLYMEKIFFLAYCGEKRF